LSEWLICFQSFGFVLSVQPEKSQEVIQLFSEREIAASIIGGVTEQPMIILKNSLDSKLLFDFRKDKITGIGHRSKDFNE
ncbi:MAG: hypothetical protein HXY44_05220, partial [Syntrophaceae bacterium]|nr:hypothetical protein [Syntrophaceae bacterium]